MKEAEVLKLLSVMVTAYPMVQLSDEMITLWTNMLVDVEYNTAAVNLAQHIKSSKYAPSIAEVRGIMTASKVTLQLREETKERLALMESWKQNAGRQLLKKVNNHG